MSSSVDFTDRRSVTSMNDLGFTAPEMPVKPSDNYYMYNGYYFTKTFPEAWSIHQLPGTGTECATCMMYGSWNGTFCAYCVECAANKYNFLRGGGVAYLHLGEYGDSQNQNATIRTYLKDIPLNKIGDQTLFDSCAHHQITGDEPMVYCTNPTVFPTIPVIPTEESPVEELPTAESPTEESPAEESPAEESPAEESPTEESPAEESPIEESPVEESPIEESPVEELPVEELPVEELPVGEPPSEELPAEELPAEELPVEEPQTVESPVGEPPTEELPTEELPTEELPVGEPPTEELPVEELPVEEPQTEELPTEEPPAVEEDGHMVNN